MKLLLNILGFIGILLVVGECKNINGHTYTEKELILMNNPRIVGGSDAEIYQYRHQISLRYKNVLAPENPYNHRCGGSILDSTTILTAAHCIIATVPSQFQVVAGTSKRVSSDGFIARVKEIIMHEKYNPDTLDNDIAMLILNTPLPLNNVTIGAIELLNFTPKDGQTCIVTGWGTTTEGGTASNQLQQVKMPIVSNEKCNEDYDGIIFDSMLCAGFRNIGGYDACQGDSGGPLVIDNKLAGIVSWGYGCARPEYPGVYSNVPYFNQWISDNHP